jgi:hypothetical protein
MPLRSKIRPDKAEYEDCGSHPVEDDTALRPDFSPQPAGTKAIVPISSSIAATIHPLSVTPRSSNWQKTPVAAIPVL